MFSFDFHNTLPGQVLAPLNEVVQAVGLTWGRLDQLRFLPVVIDGSARDAGNTSYTDVLRPGLLLGKIKSGGDVNKYIQWSPSATDGSNRIAAILMTAQKQQYMGSDSDRFIGYVCFGGPIRAAAIQIPTSTTTGIVGNASEYMIRRQLSPYFQLDDDPAGVASNGAYYTNGAGNLTVTAAMNGTTFINTALANYTLPVTPSLGLEYTFYNAADVNLTITSGAANTMIVFNDIAAGSVSLQTAAKKAGGSFRVIGTGSTWLVIPSLWADGTLTQTVTIAT